MPINQITKYCHEKYSLKKGQCKGCPNKEAGLCLSKDCGSCFTDIFFHGNRTYNCVCSTYSYVCRYIFQYTSEILHALLQYKNLFEDQNNFKYLNIMSIGCGPCSELFAIDKFVKEIDYNRDISFNGFDNNTIWNDIQNEVKKVIPFSTTVYSENCFDHIKNNSSFIFPNVLILNYVISDIITFKGDINNFIENIVAEIIDKMPDKSIIIINDINHNTKSRNHYEIIFNKIEINNNVKQFACRFGGHAYGTPYANNNIFRFTHPSDLRALSLAYKTKTCCSSAQLLIYKVSNK